MPEHSEPRSTTRRRFLTTAAIGAASATVASSVLGGCACAPSLAHTGLTAADLEVGDVVCPANASYFVARDEAGYFAYSNQCTHEGCAIPCPGGNATRGTTSGTSVCPCHESEFDGAGRVVRGPATQDLPHHSLSFDGNGASASIVVDTCVELTDSTTRARLPV